MTTILIVEDNEKNMKLARDVLQSKGYATLEAVTGEEGVRLAVAHKPDLVVIGNALSRGNPEVEAVLVLPSHDNSVDWRTWMTATNNRLVWSFVRYDGIGFELNATGTKQHWSPVIPAGWMTERIAP